MKKLLLLVLASSSLCAMNSGTLSIKKSDIFASQALGKVRVLRDNDGFKVKQNGKLYDVNSFDVDKNLRGMNNDQLARLLKQKNALIKVNKLSNGDFTLGLDGKIKGGGAGGALAGIMTGKFLVHGAAQLVIMTAGTVIGTVATPAAGLAFVYAAEKATLPIIELASNVVAVGTGMIGAVATGPI